MRTVRITGIPLDLGQERRGVDMGPSAVRGAGLKFTLESLGLQVEDAGNMPVKIPETQQVGDQAVKYLHEIAATCRQVAEKVKGDLESGSLPLVLGGDHSIAVGTLAGLGSWAKSKNKKVGCLWLDAHADMNTPETSPSGNVHGMPLAVSLGYGAEPLTHLEGFAPKIAPENTALVGVRNLDPAEREVVRKSGITVFTMRDIDEQGLRGVMEKALATATNGTAGFLASVDMDVVDPNEAPGVGTPVRGGMTFREAHLATELIADTEKLLALDLVEINPIIDVYNQTAVLGVGMIASALGKKIL